MLYLVTLLALSFAEQKLFIAIKSIIIAYHFFFTDYTFGIASKKSSPNLRSSTLSPMLSSREFYTLWLLSGARTLYGRLGQEESVLMNETMSLSEDWVHYPECGFVIKANLAASCFCVPSCLSAFCRGTSQQEGPH